MSIYSDLNEVTPTNTAYLQDVNSVYQALFNLFSTGTNQRLFLPQYGIDIDNDVFELINDITALDIEKNVIDAITRWESRVVLDTSNTSITPDYDNNAYIVKIAFQIIGLQGQTFTYMASFTS